MRNVKFYVDVRPTAFVTSEGMSRLIEMMESYAAPVLENDAVGDKVEQVAFEEAKQREKDVKCLREEIRKLEIRRGESKTVLDSVIQNLKDVAALQQDIYWMEHIQLLNELHMPKE